ncbi:MAG: hypothetical protein ACOX6O_06230 [Christensenellales bacterium]|jgi:hypothetical protein
MKRSTFTAFLVCLVILVSMGAFARADFTPADAAHLTSATLVWQPGGDWPRPQGKAITTTIEDDRLTKVAKLISGAKEMEAGSGCPFYGEAMLTLLTDKGQEITLELAADDCTVYKLGERYFDFMPPEYRNMPERPHNDLLYDLFTWQERVRRVDHSDPKSSAQLYPDWRDAYGSPLEWQLSTWVRFGEIFRPYAEAFLALHPDDMDTWLIPMMMQRYVFPGKKDLSWEEAVHIARGAARERLGVSQEEMLGRISYAMFIANDPEKPVWKLHFYDGERVEGTPFFQMDGRTGEIQDMGRWPASINYVAAFTEGRDQMAEHMKFQPGHTKRPDGKPGCWYSDCAPEYYWKTLDAHPMLLASREEWEKAYGPTQEFWPVEIKAIHYLRGLASLNDQSSLPGLPAPGEMQAKEALVLARAELDNSPLVTPEEKARLKPDMNFYFYEQPCDHGNIWMIMFRDPEHEDLAVIYSVMIDAGNGRIMESIGPGEGNG